MSLLHENGGLLANLHSHEALKESVVLARHSLSTYTQKNNHFNNIF